MTNEVLSASPGELRSDTQITVLADWRQLSYAERGAVGGKPVFVFHDLPGSRLQQHPDRSMAVARGLRLLHPDRPGFGMATPKQSRSFQDSVADIAQLADVLHIESFSIAAMGGGAPFALACAAAMPERVTRVAIASTYVPPQLLEKMDSWRLRMKLLLTRRAPSSLRALLKKDSFRARHDSYRYLDRWERQLASCDKALLDGDEILRGQFEQDAREAFRQSTRGVRADLQLLAFPWDIPFMDIRSELRFWHGSEDRIVNVISARRFVDSLPGAQLEVVEGAGHLVWCAQWAAMLDFLNS